MSNTPSTIKIVDTIGADVCIPNIQIETAGGVKINLPMTYEELDKIDAAQTNP